MTAGNLTIAACLAALLLAGGPLLDEAADAELQAASVLDAQQQAQATATMARWARHHCRDDAAVSLQAEGDGIACIDAQGQRIARIVVARAAP